MSKMISLDKKSNYFSPKNFCLLSYNLDVSIFQFDCEQPTLINKTMRQRNQKQVKRVSSEKKIVNQPSLLSPQLEQKIVHLQTMLMLSQLNSAFRQFHINIHKATSKLDNVFFRIKMHAFLSTQNYRNDLLQLNTKRDSFESAEKKIRMDKVSEELVLSLEEDNLSQQFEKYKRNADYQQIAANTFVKCESKLSRFASIIIMKRKALMSLGFYRLEHHRQMALNQIYSEKSSKLETNDSQKSKIFRRSVQRKQNRKSFSLQKSGLSPKHEFYVPVKYQPSRATYLNTSQQQKVLPNNSYISSMLNRFLQSSTEKSKERRNNLQIDREKKEVKCISTKKYNTSLATQERQDKICELQYLRRKYKKLIDQFSWFSQRFLKVIEEEEIVQ